MDVAAELLGLGAALLVLLGAVASLCVGCSRRGGKRSEKILEQSSLPEDQQSFVVSQTYSVITQACPGASMDSIPEVKSARKDKLLLFSPAVEEPECSRYQNSSKGSRLGSDTAYIDPLPKHCYNWGRHRESPGEDDDAASYENVLICRQDPDSGDEASEDYQNSASIQRWRQSRGRVEPAQREDEDEEPDYVNRDMMSAEA
ncbi:linker for activation of T-cells family member 2 [Sorex fumeus]|uniref:linker for activation of T-cells family member 2 n=1 Tax=Sorex fumeus TaxID=62283 RepID=UPI0024AD2422|nr:linker for activation of T-cells family member 2 [Sorex fumeus]